MSRFELRTARRRPLGLIATLLVAVSMTSCRHDLANSYRSAETLANAVLEALQREDAEALWALMVTRDEHERLLWEQLPSREHFSFEYVRDLNERNSRKALDSALRKWGGADFEFVSLEFNEPKEEYEGFTLYLGAELTVRRRSDGQEGILPILDVLVNYGGRWKLLNIDE